MSTVVCQGLQSHFESQLVESSPRTLRLKLAPPKPQISQPLEFSRKASVFDSNPKDLREKCHTSNSLETNQLNYSSNPDSNGWSFIQTLSPISQNNPKESWEKESSYVHPLAKRSLSTLSEKSLELCTENLGCETGTSLSENNIFSFSPLDKDTGISSPTREQKTKQPRQLLGAKKASARSFPPPLTTIRGSESYQFRPHREDGRLVIKAIKAPSKNPIFHVERSHGRLRLSILKENNATNFDSEISLAEEDEGKSEENENEVFENEARDEENAEDEEEDENDGVLSKDMDGNIVFVGARFGMEKFQRPSRCKEDRHGGNNEGLLNLEPFWVATS